MVGVVQPSCWSSLQRVCWGATRLHSKRAARATGGKCSRSVETCSIRVGPYRERVEKLWTRNPLLLDCCWLITICLKFENLAGPRLRGPSFALCHGKTLMKAARNPRRGFPVISTPAHAASQSAAWGEVLPGSAVQWLCCIYEYNPKTRSELIFGSRSPLPLSSWEPEANWKHPSHWPSIGCEVI